MSLILSRADVIPDEISRILCFPFLLKFKNKTAMARAIVKKYINYKTLYSANNGTVRRKNFSTATVCYS